MFYYKFYVVMDFDNGYIFWFYNFGFLIEVLFWLEIGFKISDIDFYFNYKEWMVKYIMEIEIFKDLLCE